MTEIQTPPTIKPKSRTLTLICTKHKYNHEVTPITLVEDSETADAIAKLIERGGATGTVLVMTVPMWPEIKSEED